MSAADTIIIKPLPLTKVRALHGLFATAVRTSFTYFGDDIQNRTIRQHRPWKLLLGVFHPRRVMLTAWRGEDLVGYAIGSVPRGGAGQLYWLYVAASERGNNTGLALLSRTLRLERKLGARSVTLATHDHRRYYERQGFKFVDTRTIDGVAMDVMRYSL